VVKRLQVGAYRNAEVASRVKVNKSQEEYKHSRSERQEAVYEALLRAGRPWRAGERLVFYQQAATGLSLLEDPEGCNYDAPFYVQQLMNGYANRLKKGMRHADFQQLFAQEQGGLFDIPVAQMRPVWRTCRHP